MEHISKTLAKEIKNTETDEFNQLNSQIDTTLSNLRRKEVSWKIRSNSLRKWNGT